MPRFPGCENLESTKEIEQCALEKLLDFIYKNLKYPLMAKLNQTSGKVVVQFIVSPEGLLEDCMVTHDIGDGCGKAALDLLDLMNEMPEKWIPGKEGERPVYVLYTLPISIKLPKN